MRPCIVNRAASRTHVTHERAAALISSPQQLTESRHPSSCGKHVSEITCIQPSSSLTGAMGSCAPLAHRARVSSCVLWAWLSSPSGQYWRRQPYLVNAMIKGFHSDFVNAPIIISSQAWPSAKILIAAEPLNLGRDWSAAEGEIGRDLNYAAPPPLSKRPFYAPLAQKGPRRDPKSRLRSTLAQQHLF